jgi:hypothetical protein
MMTSIFALDAIDALDQIVRHAMKIKSINLRKIFNGGGGGKAPPPPPPPAPAPPPPPAEDSGPDPAMQAEIERQRALRFKAGELGSADTPTGAGTDMQDTTQQKTLLGE